MAPTDNEPASRGAWAYCWCCGERHAFDALHCPHCGAEPPDADSAAMGISPKSFTTAVVLCGIFGTIGIHHFYIGNWLHGLLDFGLFVGSMTLWFTAVHSGRPDLLFVALGLFAIDLLHTIYVFFRLITGQQLDSMDRRIAWPGEISQPR
tara:strand:+ start:82 stop:531 length:450 start_codon:yes stop_codon:yes gene_type:complete